MNRTAENRGGANPLTELRATFASGQTRAAGWRRGQLDALGKLLDENEPRILQALAEDLGKPAQEALAELSIIRAEIRHARRHLRRWMRRRRVFTPLVGQPARSWVQPEPLGVVLIISAWNYPFQVLLAPLVPALAAGNCAVLKPSELAPASSALIAELTPRYLDHTAVRVVQGGVEETQALLSRPFDHIVFTGSTAVGRIVMRAAAEHLTPVTLELGGKSPCIVDDTADIPGAARRIAWGKWLNAGQTCIAPDYVLVSPARRDRLIAEIGNCLKRWYGDDAATGGDYARIINDRHFQRLRQCLEQGDIRLGGTVDATRRHIQPTVLADVAGDSELMQEEIFGPLLPVLAVDDLDQAIDFISTRAKPLAAYLFTRSRRNERRFLDAVSAGSVCINDTLMFMTVPGLPFGGVGPSGMGQYKGRAGFDRLSHLKAVMRRARWPELPVRFPPYTRLKMRLLRLLS